MSLEHLIPLVIVAITFVIAYLLGKDMATNPRRHGKNDQEEVETQDTRNE